ncbi:MAG: hypothetical protein ACREX0_17095 [Noviherbaspirillum sp.]
MSGQSLERERQSILNRMQARRETYRRVLNGEQDFEDAIMIDTNVDGSSAHGHPVAAYAPARGHYPRSALARVIGEHPLLCALGVAAVIVIGPKRIARTVLKGGSSVASLTARNQPNIDLVGRLLTMAGAYVQGRTKQGRPR